MAAIKVKTEIMDFFQAVAATPDFSFGSKQIYTFCNGKPKLLKWYRQSDEELTLPFFRNDKDYYITKNSFIANRRGSDCLFSFDNIVIDCDAHTTGTDFAEIDHQIDKLLYLLDTDYDGKFPRCNVVRSGRGVHLWIGLESFSAKLLSMQLMYQMICRYFCDILEQILTDNDIALTVDRTASNDASRVMRIPCTYNQNRKDYLTVWEHRTDRRYSFQELMQEFPIEIRKKTTRKQESEDNTQYVGMHRKRIDYIESLIADAHGECSGKRDKLLFLWYNHAVMIMDRQTATDKLRQLNQRFTKPMRASEVKLITDYIDKQGHLRFKTATFHDWCESDTRQRMDYMSHTAREMERAAAREKKQQRNNRICSLKAEGMTVREIAAEVGCSKNTVTAVLNAEPLPCTDTVAEPETETPAMNAPAKEALEVRATIQAIALVKKAIGTTLAISDSRSVP